MGLSTEAEDCSIVPLDSERYILTNIDIFTPIHDDPYIMGQIAGCNVTNDLYALNALEIHNFSNFLGLPTNIPLDFPEKISQLISNAGSKPEHIILEVTETALMDELAKSLDILTRLRLKGFKLSIDDFGTGYSSLVQLHRAPFSEIKIDKSFVLEMENEPEARAIVETIVMLGHKLNMKVVAEGVETRKAQNILKEIGCDITQGYYFAHPMPTNEFEQWLSRN